MRLPCTRWWRRRKILSLSPLVAGRACSRPIFPAGVANAAHKASPKRSVGHRGRWYYRGGEYNGSTGVRSDHGGQGTAHCLRAQARIAAQRAYWSVEYTKYNSDKLLLRIAAILEHEYGAQSHIIRSKHSSGVPAHKEIIDEYTASCDVVIAGVGD